MALAVIGSALVLVAAVIHLVIFVLESILWTRPAVWRLFGLRSQEQAETMRPMAFNQGYYNLFLAIGAGSGLVLLGAGDLAQAGLALAIFACASMVLAAVVLVASSPKLVRAAAVQGVAPLLGVLLLVLSQGA